MFNKILVPIDMQEISEAEKILDIADRLAKQFQASVHVMTVVPGYTMPIVAGYFPEDAKETAKRELEKKLKSLVSKSMKTKVECSVIEGKRAETILGVSKQEGADLILIGRHPGGHLLGSVGTSVAQRSDCSVMVVQL